jgi:hypothetical protein
MPHDAKDFYKYGKPVGELFQTLSESYFDTYEEGRPFGEGVDDTYPDDYPESRWGLNLGCVQHNTPAWGESCLRSVQNHVLYYVVANAQSNRETLTAFFAKPDEDPSPDKALQNLSNAWRDEFALNDPLEGSVEDRMRTAEWRITMCYYAIYKAFSGLMRATFEEIRASGGGGSHGQMWKKHRTSMLTELEDALYVYPFMPFPVGRFSDEAFDWTIPYPAWAEQPERLESRLATNAERELEAIYELRDRFHRKPDSPCPTFFDLLLDLRHWANYHRGGIFSRLYGGGYKFAIDEGLRITTFAGLAIAEVGLIHSLDYDTVKEEYEGYRRSAEEGIEESARLVSRRFSVYEEVFGNNDA